MIDIDMMENLIEQLTVTASGVGEYSRDSEGNYHRNNKLSRRGTAYIIKCLRQYIEIQKIVEEWNSISDRETADASIVCYFSKILAVFKEKEK